MVPIFGQIPLISRIPTLSPTQCCRFLSAVISIITVIIYIAGEKCPPIIRWQMVSLYMSLQIIFPVSSIVAGFTCKRFFIPMPHQMLRQSFLISILERTKFTLVRFDF